MNNTNTNLRNKTKNLKQSIYDYFRRARASYRFQAELKTKLRKPKAILIHQMGKVGSSAVVVSLEALKLDTPIYHTHYLNPDQIRHRLEKIKSEGRKLKVGSHLITSQYLSKIIARNLSEKEWKVITLVREPISRNISAFFQNIDIFIPDFLERYKEGSLETMDIINIFLTSYSHDLPLKWFDEEIKNVFNIDIFKSEFPKSKGYKILNNKNLSLLVIRLENLNQCYKNAFEEFMNVNNFKLNSVNLSIQKDYYEAYKNFKSELILPGNYIETMYCSKYMHYFYTTEEIDIFKQKWSK